MEEPLYNIYIAFWISLFSEFPHDEIIHKRHFIRWIFSFKTKITCVVMQGAVYIVNELHSSK